MASPAYRLTCSLRALSIVLQWFRCSGLVAVRTVYTQQTMVDDIGRGRGCRIHRMKITRVSCVIYAASAQGKWRQASGNAGAGG
ncbi:hypothetical protein NEOLEDRAFT_758030 [Neolentinus lepideus HHB14362 ss-1]|uniref:Secreted protein n=1 Tax=Neolentinus lepideus HHB14362 ss-1 TaxID=1314782 RepID=A0A165PRS2_9AGAM|nr:hypothetical protein NEOLEDRAFT_758030 [Neolentinus lepideus HHB14362 ss-1]